MKNNKGFTLVELLAVIVILAVVMLIAVTSVGPIMSRARKSAFIDEGVSLVDAAKIAYQAEQLNSQDVKANSSVCFSLAWLNAQGYFSKGDADKYHGSVYVQYNNGKYNYHYWIDNEAYYIANAEPTNTSTDIVKDSGNSVVNCGGPANVIQKS